MQVQILQGLPKILMGNSSVVEHRTLTPNVVGSNPTSPAIKAGLNSLAVCRVHNPKVAGSNPAPATNIFKNKIYMVGWQSGLMRRIANPLMMAKTIIRGFKSHPYRHKMLEWQKWLCGGLQIHFMQVRVLFQAPTLNGEVAEWFNAAVLKTVDDSKNYHPWVRILPSPPK